MENKDEESDESREVLPLQCAIKYNVGSGMDDFIQNKV